MKALVYFEIVTTLALIIGIISANIIKPGKGVHFTQGENSQVNQIATEAHDLNWGAFFSNIVPSNIIEAFAKGDILQILFFSILFAVGLKMIGAAGKWIAQYLFDDKQSAV